jgi:hypothetical protein
VTAHWLLQICTAIGVAVLGTLAFIGLAGVADWLTHRKRYGFPKSRRFH